MERVYQTRVSVGDAAKLMTPQEKQRYEEQLLRKAAQEIAQKLGLSNGRVSQIWAEIQESLAE